ncbi:hypothetical protein [Priestia flexa]|uniref:hypothetical protein n=1 Tax=Priestia flexa TaxID=86664 RepID=UPI0004734152|nr:hypothetical protein [Priestia flexa]
MANLKFKNKVTGQWEELKVDTRLTTLENDVILNTDESIVNIDITKYNPVDDVLMVFQNSVFIAKGKDYTVDAGLLAIRHIDYPTGKWNKDTSFHFLVLKNVRRQIETNDGALLQDGTVSNAKLAPEMNIGSILNLITDKKDNVVNAINSTQGGVNKLNMDVAEINEHINTIDDGLQLKATKTEVDEINQRVITNSGAIDVLNNEVAIRVKKDEYNELVDRVKSSEASIIVNADEISQRVKSTDFNGNTISSLINQTATTIKIQAKNIQFQGAVSVLSDITGNLGTITAGTLKAVNLEAATGSFTGDVTARTLIVKGIGNGDPVINIGETGARIDMRDGSLRMQQNPANYFSINNDGSHIFWKDNKQVIRFELSDDGHRLAKSGWAALKFLTNNYTLQARTNDDTDYAHFAAKDITATGLFKSINNASLESTNGYAALTARGTDQIAYLRSKNEARVVDSDDFNVYRSIRASSFPTNSSVKSKTNIEPFLEDANALLKDVNIYKYHLQSDVDSGVYDKKRVGMLSETVPALIRDEDGVDVYIIASLLWKQNQEQLEMIEEVNKENDDLKTIVSVLSTNVQDLSSRIDELSTPPLPPTDEEEIDEPPVDENPEGEEGTETPVDENIPSEENTETPAEDETENPNDESEQPNEETPSEGNIDEPIENEGTTDGTVIEEEVLPEEPVQDEVTDETEEGIVEGETPVADATNEDETLN